MISDDFFLFLLLFSLPLPLSTVSCSRAVGMSCLGEILMTSLLRWTGGRRNLASRSWGRRHCWFVAPHPIKAWLPRTRRYTAPTCHFIYRDVYCTLQRTAHRGGVYGTNTHTKYITPMSAFVIDQSFCPLLFLSLPSLLHRFSRSCFSQVRYRAEWSSETAFRSVLISPRMIADHMPDAVLRSLHSMTQDRPFNLCPSSLSNSHLNVIWVTLLHTYTHLDRASLTVCCKAVPSPLVLISSLPTPSQVPQFLSLFCPYSMTRILNSEYKGTRQLDFSIKGLCRIVFLIRPLERVLSFDYLFM